MRVTLGHEWPLCHLIYWRRWLSPFNMNRIVHSHPSPSTPHLLFMSVLLCQLSLFIPRTPLSACSVGLLHSVSNESPAVEDWTEIKQEGHCKITAVREVHMNEKEIVAATVYGEWNLQWATQDVISHITSHLHIISKDAPGSCNSTMGFQSITLDFILGNFLARLSHDSGLLFFFYRVTKNADNSMSFNVKAVVGSIVGRC